MKFKDFMNMYDDWNGKTVVNNDDLTLLVKGLTLDIVEDNCWSDMEVVSFGFYDSELCVRVR